MSLWQMFARGVFEKKRSIRSEQKWSREMVKKKIMKGIMAVDTVILKGRMKKFHARHLKYRGKATILTATSGFPPHVEANKAVKLSGYGDLLAIGGDLSSQRLIAAYQAGIFPLSQEYEPLLWWTSEIRCVIYPHKLRIPHNINRILRQGNFRLTVDQAFAEVVEACREKREQSTWLTLSRIKAIHELHQWGVTHSVEVWQEEQLVGGLFFTALGSFYMGESMFTRVNNASKVGHLALSLRLKELGYVIQDCGFLPTEHLTSLGAEIITRAEFLELIAPQEEKSPVLNWSGLFDEWDLSDAIKRHLSSPEA
jgi:leucyl/phenylalanyl-tRNA--protein transferase